MNQIEHAINQKIPHREPVGINKHHIRTLCPGLSGRLRSQEEEMEYVSSLEELKI